ncbi:GNAT family N-acetyltransferase [Paracoccus versutus]|uniref:Putative acetyltransferase n=1 Tax=Paracoccus versutus TaxID=34007 RepID=A0A3D9XSR3_PARVE|nr:N-acetyltransferase [Paracoccus versutus]REF73480.1 putative acetyltransferase [Paracoccus versutus]WGR54756.1 N-acetyltransferase [Paracoccus versutus]
MDIRLETPADAAAIRQITQEAFAGAEHSSGTEGAIIDSLRAAGTLTLSLVAEEGRQVIGHAAFSPVMIGGRDAGWFGLGPVAVRPDRQGQGAGGVLIREGLARLRGMGAQGCVVLGDPGYYRRFGFAVDPGLTFEGVPPEYFMALAFAGPPPSGAVIYHAAFYES